MKVGFRTKLIVIMGVCSLLLTFTVSYIDQHRLTTSLLAEREIQKQLIEDNIMTSIANIDNAYDVLNKDLDEKMEAHSIRLGELYQSNPNFDEWDFELLKEESDGLDIYIVNDDLVITHSSYEVDIGFDFNTAPEFADNLTNILTSGTFVVDYMDIETLTGNLRKYSYFPTHDNDFIIELGFPMTNNELFERLSFLDVTANLVDTYSMVDDITIYTQDGAAFGKLTSDGDTLRLNDHYTEAIRDLRNVEDGKLSIQGEENPGVTHEFIPYILPTKTDNSLQYSDYRIVEIVYNNHDFDQLLAENRQVFFYQLLITAIIALLVSFFIAKLVARPMHLAFHDLLTGLSNRAAFQIELDKKLKKTKKTSYAFGILLIDLDNFKLVNDSLGHDTGDYLLIEFAKRIKRAVNREGMIARMGGDEFAIIIDNLTSEEDAVRVADIVLQEATRPLLIGETNVTEDMDVSASVGIAFAPYHGIDAQTLYRHADMALYEAKHKGKNAYKIYGDTNTRQQDNVSHLI